MKTTKITHLPHASGAPESAEIGTCRQRLCLQGHGPRFASNAYNLLGLIALVWCSCTAAFAQQTFTVISGTLHNACGTGSYCNDWTSDVYVYVTYNNMAAGTYHIYTNDNSYVTFSVPAAGSGTVSAQAAIDGYHYPNYVSCVLRDRSITGSDTGYSVTGGYIALEQDAQGSAYPDCPPSVPCGAHGFQTFAATYYVNRSGSSSSEYDKSCDRKDGGDQCKDCGSKAMARYSAHSVLASLNIEDTPIGYSPPRGPAINFTVTYNQRDTQQPQTFNYSNLGPRWTFNWLSYVTDDPNNMSADATVYVAGGGAEKYSGFDSGSQSYQADPQSHAILVRTAPATYEKRFSDGSKQVFTLSDGSSSFPRKIFMTQWVDSAGNAVAISYDPSFRVTSLTDALGQITTIAYELPSDPLKITKVTEPFPIGRYAAFAYNGNGQLTTITDEIGIQSIFTYSTDGLNFITSLQTPYGTSTFTTGQNGSNRWIEMTDPLGGLERVEYRDNAPGIGASESVAPAGMTNSALDVANTFYWDKKATLMYPPVNGVYDYTKARIIHWATNSNGSISGIIASERAALENRVWSTYSGQADTNHVGSTASPSQVARILDDGTTQLWQYQYNTIGKMTQSTDSIGRVMSYTYDANNIDLLNVRQITGGGNDLLRTLTYNSLHEPLTDKDAAGQTTIYTYRPDGHGQLQSAQNARGETTTYNYGPVSGVPTGYLASITSPTFNGSTAATSFTYDTANRVRTVTNSPDNYSVTTDYDNLDRPTTITYPDSTTQTLSYTQDFGQGAMSILDLTVSSDRRGRITTRHYDRNRHIDSITEPFGNNSTRTTTYRWCTCGSLTSITDPNSHVTTLNRDLQSRVTSKVYDNQTAVSYVYENTTSRLKSMTDANNQTTNYQYFGDNDLKQVSYTNAQIATPTVNFTYDPNYDRVVTMADGTGTTGYGYYAVANPPALGATQLQTVDGPLANDTITYGYDELGRAVSQSINGVSSSVAYDSLGRLNTSDNPLGHFTRAYESNVTPRLKTLTSPTGQTANYTYFDNSHDRRLQTLQDLTSGSANITKFDYTYDPEGQISPTWIKQLSTSPANTSNLSYDSADQLTQVVNTTPNNPSTTFTYGYDQAGNRMNDSNATYGINDVNEITNTGYAYDANGNLTTDGVNTYQWDAANRMTKIIYPGVGGRTEFTYDGLGRRVKLVEKDNPGTVLKTSNFIWSGTTIAEERDASNTVVKRFLAEGIQFPTGTTPNTKLYYSKDHLGSIRSLTNENGTILGTLDYDAFGGISRAPVPANDTSGSGPVLISAVSRLTHGSAGTFDVNLPLTDAPGIEMRSGANYTLVLTFDRNVLSDTSTTIAAGIGTVGSTTFNGNTATVSLSGVSDRQTITVELDNVVGAVGVNSKVLVSMSVLVGDVNQSGAVTVEDFILVQANSGFAVTNSTFKYDTTHNGAINSSDIGSTQTLARQGDSLYPDFAFTGHYYHARSGLYLTMYRAYNPNIGRWLSRDPIGEAEGLNLYSYVVNDPIDRIDILGLQSAASTPPATPIPLPPRATLPWSLPQPVPAAAPTPWSIPSVPANWYGHYCGPGGSGAPIDCVDNACKNHDDCYARCKTGGPAGVIMGGACVRDCDAKLCAAAKACPCPSEKARAARAVIAAIFCSTQHLP
jgi:RHS repeat-associated protein